MALLAEWDPTTGNVVQIKNDDYQAGQTAGGYTGAERTTGSATTWYPLEVEYPEEYVPRFPELLGPGTMTLEDGVVYHRFPTANYSERAVREALVAEVKKVTGNALSQTDWYIIRQFETAEPVPEAVATARLRIRALGQSRQQAVRDASPSDLLDFDTSLNVGVITYHAPQTTLRPVGA
jgi:hypothetical protein